MMSHGDDPRPRVHDGLTQQRARQRRDRPLGHLGGILGGAAAVGGGELGESCRAVLCTPLARDDQPSLLFILGRRVGFVRRWRGSARVHHEVDHEVDPHMSRVRVLAAVRAGAHILHGLFSREAWT